MLKISVADVEPLVSEYKGNIAAIARKLGVSRSTVWARCNESKTLMQALEDARESMIDNAESKLYSKILDGDMTAIIFFLKTQGKKRGYIERQEHTGANGEPLQFNTVIALTVEQELAEWRKQQQQTIAAQSSTTNAA